MTSTPPGAPTLGTAPETAVSAFVPVQTRSERPRSVNPADFAEVTGRELEWRLSPVSALRPLIDGELDGSDYPISVVGGGATASVEFVNEGESARGLVGIPEERLSANAWSQVTSVLRVALGGDSAQTVTITRDGLGSTARAAHTLITAAANSHSMLVIRSVGEGLLAESVEIVVEQGASLELVSVQDWAPTAVHHAVHFARVARDATLTHTVVTLGGSTVVVNPSVRLSGQGSTGEMYGVYFAEGSQHLEDRVFVHHEGPDTVSRVTYKGALHGRGARTVWIGDVLIGPDAVGTDSYEQNRNLVLSEGTRADSIPNLEIQTGDIRGAGHASATGRFDDMHLFYLTSRGIPEVEARRLVVRGFLSEVLQKITDEALRGELTEKMMAKLSHTEEETS
jgi:Fe-S cluster assembly protein SufD